jgi:TonB-linked SusC/RagA family outer membrane protein
MKRLIPSVVFGLALLLLPGLAWAQQGTVTGTVTEAETGQVLPGATVQIQGEGTGAATDVEGQYRITGVPTGEQTIRVSFVGYQASERTVNVPAGGTVRANFQLQSGAQELDEVVVTGQQVQRQERSLGYSVTSLSNEQIEGAQEENLVKSLSGKVAGVDITSQSGNVGGGARIVLRGIASLGGDNQPLFVVDGVPVSNSNISSGSRLVGAYDTGNKAGQLNPDNIESISVLKSGAAAALYGQRAKNGVILIETKGGQGTGASASFSSSLTFSRPTVLPDFQNEYGPGSGGKYNVDNLNGWGPRMEGQEVEIYTGETVPLTPAEDNVSNFYDTGTLVENNVSFSNATENADFRFGVSSTNNAGIVPNSELDRYNINGKGGARAFDGRLEARLSANYVKESTEGRVASGGNDPNTLVGIVNFLPRNLSASTLRNNFREGADQLALTQSTNNPFWVTNENVFTTDTERLFGSARVSFEVFDWLTLQERIGTDIVSEERREPNSVGTLGAQRGEVSDQVFRQRQIDHDFSIRTDNDLGDDFSLQTVFGNNINQRTFENTENTATNLNVAGLYNYTNANNNTPTNFFEQQRLVAVYGNATIGFRDYAFIELTGRNDWSSTLPKDNNSYFYPSISGSLVFTDFLKQEYDLDIPGISYGKIRANYAEVGSDEDPYQLQFTFSPSSSVFGQFGTDLEFPFNGNTSFQKTGTIPPTNLQPQRQESWEVGTELAFLNGRINLDATYYDQRTTQQILDLPIPQSTGFGQRTLNVGTLSNEGIELTLNTTPVAREDFTWQIGGNFTRNQNTVVSLAEGVDQFTLQSGFNSLQVRAKEGEEISIFGAGFARDPETGKPLINPNTGLRQAGDDKDLGDLYADFKAGFTTNVSFKGLSLDVLVDWKSGGKIFSSTVQGLRGSGLVQETVKNREGTFIDDGVIVTERDANGNITGTRPNDVPVPSMQAFWGQFTEDGIIENSVFDASYVKLREVALSYSLPQSLLADVRVQNASIELQGRNLLLLYSNVPHIDPETNLFGAGANIGQGVEFNNLPNTTTFGASINLTF